MKRRKIYHYVGIDEVGRGPLAGPVAVGAVRSRSRILTSPFFNGVKDSKHLSESRRHVVYEELLRLRKSGKLIFAVSFVGPVVIDKIGINRATHLALGRALRRLDCKGGKTHILLDGGLRAPVEFESQETIIRGDEKESLIALASIVAKVLRDKKMRRLSLKYPKYCFHMHKGYGTKLHTRRIRTNKPCTIHRKTFLRNIC